jgi:hypothetical protein
MGKSSTLAEAAPAIAVVAIKAEEKRVAVFMVSI